MKRSTPTTAATLEKPALDDEERSTRSVLLAERLRSPYGLDREALGEIEHEPGHE